MNDSVRRYLNPSEAARRLNLSLSTLAKYRVHGGGPQYRKLGRCVRYTAEDCDTWADARIRAHTSEVLP
jgi:predicted DNA-binding transcriptional regulator AlpA